MQSHEFALAKRDVPIHAGVIERGHVAGQHFEYQGLVKGVPVIQFSSFWKMSKEIEPNWPFDAPIEYVVEIEGDPSVRCSLTPIASKQVEGPKLGSLADVASKRAGGGI